MKNYLFNKTAALVMGSLIIFSGQALAFSSNNQELNNADTLSESEIFVAQSRDRDRGRDGSRTTNQVLA